MEFIQMEKKKSISVGDGINKWQLYAHQLLSIRGWKYDKKKQGWIHQKTIGFKDGRPEDFPMGTFHAFVFETGKADPFKSPNEFANYTTTIYNFMQGLQ